MLLWLFEIIKAGSPDPALIGFSRGRSHLARADLRAFVQSPGRFRSQAVSNAWITEPRLSFGLVTDFLHLGASFQRRISFDIVRR
jgi:hypothetical protein